MVMLKLEDQPPLIQVLFSGELDAPHLVDLLQDVFRSSNCDVNYQDAEKRSALHAAAYLGDPEVVDLLIEHGARVNTKDSRWLTPLHRACSVASAETVELLLQHHADTTARDRHWQTPLHIAASHNALGCIQHLLTHVINVNVTDRSGCTALHHASLNGHNDVVELLLAKGGIVNACDKKDCRPIHWAAHLGHVATVNILIQKGADINVKDRNQNTPLHAAASSGMVYVCSLLLTAGADINAQNAYGNTPLHMACLNGHLSVCKNLVTNRANIEAANYKGQTALQISAASTQGVGCLAFLLEQEHIDINRQSIDGRTALHLSAIYGRFTRSKRLIDNGAVVDCADKNGNTSLHIAAQYGHDILTATLLDFGADPTKRGYEGRTPLHVSCLSGFVEVCRKFLQEVSVDLNNADEQGRTPIHCAAYKGSVECLDLLVSRGGNFKIQDGMGRMALHYAAARGHYNCLYTLVGIGSPVNVLDAEGCSALHLAAAYDTEGKCVEYLLQHKADPLLKDGKGFTPVHYAVNGSNRCSLELLLNKIGKNVNFLEAGMPETTPLHLAARNADWDILRSIITYFPETNIKAREGYTPLMLAAREGHSHNVQMLLRYGAKVAICDDVNGMSPVHYSAKNGHVHCLALLVDNAEVKTIIDKQDKLNRTALMLAVSGSHKDCALTLLKSGSDPNIVDTDLHSSLFRAVVTDQNSVVQLLIAFGAQMTSADVNGKTVIHLAAACGHLKCLQLILSNVDQREALILDKQGFSALHWACYFGNASCLEFLLQMNNYTRLEGNAFTPMHCAAFTGSERCLELLYAKFGPDCVMSRDTRDRTPLHIAAWHGHADCVRFLLDIGVGVDARDEIGRSALISAAQNGQSQVIDLLLAHKADLKAADNNGNTPLHVACLRKHNHTALLLLEYINDVDVINTCDNEKKTALHLAARNGLVEVTGELIKKGASVTAADKNGLTPALYCAPNACVAQCLATILANHPMEFTTNNQHSKDNLKRLRKFLKPLRHSASSLSRTLQSSQTEISLLRNPRELFLVDDPGVNTKKRKTPGFHQPQNSKILKRTYAMDFGPPSSRLQPKRTVSRSDIHNSHISNVNNLNNLILIENYDTEDFDVSTLKHSVGGLELHRSFSEITLVDNEHAKDLDKDTEKECANSNGPHEDELLKAAAYEKLVKGYKTIALKMAEITNQYDVSVDDIQQAYIEQYAKKKCERYQKYQQEMAALKVKYAPELGLALNSNDSDVVPERTLPKESAFMNKQKLEKELNEQLEQLRRNDDHKRLLATAQAQSHVELDEKQLEIGAESEYAALALPKALNMKDEASNMPTLNADHDREHEAITIGTDPDPLASAMALSASDALCQGDWYEPSVSSSPPCVKRYCDCQYVCPNCVLLNRFDLEQSPLDDERERDFERLLFDDAPDESCAFPVHRNHHRRAHGHKKRHGHGLHDIGDNSDPVAEEPIPLEYLTVNEPKTYVGEGAIRKSKVLLSNAGSSNRDRVEAKYFLKDGKDCKVKDNGEAKKCQLVQINESDELLVQVKRDNDVSARASWPKVTFDESRQIVNECADITREHDLDWSLFAESLRSDSSKRTISVSVPCRKASNVQTAAAASVETETTSEDNLLDVATSATALVPMATASSSTAADISESKDEETNATEKISRTRNTSLVALPKMRSLSLVSCLNLQSQLIRNPCIIVPFGFLDRVSRTKTKFKKKAKSMSVLHPVRADKEREMIAVLQHAHDRMQDMTYQEFSDLTQGLNMSPEAKIIAQRLMQQYAIAQSQNGEGQATRTLKFSDSKEVVSKAVSPSGSDSGLESSSLDSISAESLDKIETPSVSDSNEGKPFEKENRCKKTGGCLKLKRVVKRSDDNKCLLS